jgi:hypothetical protein
MAGAARGQIGRCAPQYRRPPRFHVEPDLDLVIVFFQASVRGPMADAFRPLGA